MEVRQRLQGGLASAGNAGGGDATLQRRGVGPGGSPTNTQLYYWETPRRETWVAEQEVGQEERSAAGLASAGRNLGWHASATPRKFERPQAWPGRAGAPGRKNARPPAQKRSVRLSRRRTPDAPAAAAPLARPCQAAGMSPFKPVALTAPSKNGSGRHWARRGCTGACTRRRGHHATPSRIRQRCPRACSCGALAASRMPTVCIPSRALQRGPVGGMAAARHGRIGAPKAATQVRPCCAAVEHSCTISHPPSLSGCRGQGAEWRSSRHESQPASVARRQVNTWRYAHPWHTACAHRTLLPSTPCVLLMRLLSTCRGKPVCEF